MQAREFDVIYSGAEANLGVALAAMGVDSYLVSSVPDNAVGEACLYYVRQFGMNLDHVIKRGYRLGIYYVETGAAQRPVDARVGVDEVRDPCGQVVTQDDTG